MLRIKLTKEKRIRKEVFAVVQKAREDKVDSVKHSTKSVICKEE